MSAEQAANIIATVSPEGMVGRLVELTRENADLKAKLAQVEADAAAAWEFIERNPIPHEHAEGINECPICDERSALLNRPCGQRLLDEIEGLKRSVHASSKDIVRLETELSTLRATAQRRLELLRKWEENHVCCEMCSMISAHRPTCPLAQELKEGGK